MSVQHWSTFGIAVLGAVLGVMNTWLHWRKECVRLRVIGKSIINAPFPEAGNDRFKVEVVNLSAFPVVIEKMVFYRRRWWFFKKEVLSIENEQLPKTLGARKKFEWDYFQGMESADALKNAWKVGAKTEHGILKCTTIRPAKES